LRIVEQFEQGRVNRGRHFDAAGRELAIIVQAAGNGARENGVDGSGQQRDGRRFDFESDAAGAGHFSGVTDEAETRDVRAAVDSETQHGFAGRAVQCQHGRGGGFDGGGWGDAALERGSDNSGAEGFGEDEHIARLGTAVGFDAFGMDSASDRVAEFDFGIVDAVAAEDGASGFAHFFEAAAQDGFEDVEIGGFFAGAGKSDDGESGEGSASHGIHVAERIGGGDGAEGERVVYDRGEEVNGLDECEILAEKVHSGIVGCIEADKDIRVDDARQGAEHFVQQLWTQFRRSTGRFDVGGKHGAGTNFRHSISGTFVYNHKTMRTLLPCFAFCAVISLAFAGKVGSTDPRLKNAYRLPVRNGWTYVHLEGTPSEIGFQHGWLLSKEIKDGFDVQKLEAEHDSKKTWAFFRNAGRGILWPRIPDEYRQEMEGIAAGLKARGVPLDIWDVVAMNAAMEWSYYTEQYDKEHGIAKPKTVTAPDHCSAFVATGSYTKDGKFVIAHNNWSSYLDGERWTIAFDVKPAAGHRFVMDGYPGLIHSGDDFGINDAGIAITETTISNFHGWDSKGVPEFARARKAMQYAESIDDFSRIMRDGNNGGYANDWLVADTKTNEIASLELGLKNVELRRTKDGYFTGANFPINRKLLKEETDFDANDPSLSSNARRVRWEELMKKNKGRIDAAMAEQFLADHYDTVTKKVEPSEHTLCGHVDLSPRGMGEWKAKYEPAGAVQNKVSDAAMARKMTFLAAAGHACGLDFKAAPHMAAHPEFRWEAGLLHDMNAQGWTQIRAR
jgi:hypothetical protein